jgi:hypothetical protein
MVDMLHRLPPLPLSLSLIIVFLANAGRRSLLIQRLGRDEQQAILAWMTTIIDEEVKTHMVAIVSNYYHPAIC